MSEEWYGKYSTDALPLKTMLEIMVKDGHNACGAGSCGVAR